MFTKKYTNKIPPRLYKIKFTFINKKNETRKGFFNFRKLVIIQILKKYKASRSKLR